MKYDAALSSAYLGSTPFSTLFAILPFLLQANIENNNTKPQSWNDCELWSENDAHE